MSPHPLTNFEMQLFYQNEPIFNGVCSGNKLPKIKDEEYVINLDEYKSIGTHWVVFNVNGDNAIYFDSLGVKHIAKEFKKVIGNENITTNIYGIQASIRFNNVWIFLH